MPHSEQENKFLGRGARGADTLYRWSNTGSCVDVFAPGVEIFGACGGASECEGWGLISLIKRGSTCLCRVILIVRLLPSALTGVEIFGACGGASEWWRGGESDLSFLMGGDMRAEQYCSYVSSPLPCPVDTWRLRRCQ